LKTKLQKLEQYGLEQGETVDGLLQYYTDLGYSAGLIAEVFEVSGHTVRKWFKHFGLQWRKFPLQELKVNTPTGNAERVRQLGLAKAKVVNGINVPQRERELDLARGTIHARLKRGWAVNAALNTKKDDRVRARSRIGL